MAQITRVKDLSDAFKAVRNRIRFVYHHSPAMRFVYHPIDDKTASLIVARADDYPSAKDYESVVSEMGIFLNTPPFAQFTVGSWKCLQFRLESVRLE